MKKTKQVVSLIELFTNAHMLKKGNRSSFSEENLEKTMKIISKMKPARMVFRKPNFTFLNENKDNK